MRVYFGILPAFLAGFGWADTVVLSNGDRLNGQLLAEEDGIVLFETDRFGLLELAVDEVTVERDAPPARVSGADQPGPTSADPEPSNPVALEAPKLDQAALKKNSSSEGNGKNGFAMRLPENLKGEVGVSYMEKSGQANMRQVGVDGKVGLHTDSVKANWKAHYREFDVKGDDRESMRDFGVGQKLRYESRERFYAEANTRYEEDDYRKKRNEFSQTAAVGVTPVKNSKVTINIAPGIKAQHVSEAEQKDLEGTRYKVNAHQDLTWKVNKDVQVGQELDYSVDPRNPEDWDLGVRAYMQTKVSDAVNLRLHYQYDFENTARKDAKKNSEVGASVVFPF